MNKKEKDIWQQLLSRIEKHLKPQNFKTWFKPIQLYSLTQDKLTIQVPNDFFKEWIKERYLKKIKEEMKQLTGRKMEVDFIFFPRDNYTYQTKRSAFKRKSAISRLNPKYSFSSFVVGNNNRLAHAAALAVAQSPACAYNPLFLYGKVGLGKTHLLQAIAHYIMKNKDEITFTYLSSEEFTNELINAIKNRRTTQFR
ncbi:chromosomal replication initiator protein DnaA, partial [Candidatus Aerophobetes bacterium]|nr:chromosomal replication initiator protein DnaA [Candidatus Aerophobetes bacterium]